METFFLLTGANLKIFQTENENTKIVQGKQVYFVNEEMLTRRIVLELSQPKDQVTNLELSWLAGKPN